MLLSLVLLLLMLFPDATIVRHTDTAVSCYQCYAVATDVTVVTAAVAVYYAAVVSYVRPYYSHYCYLYECSY